MASIINLKEIYSHNPQIYLEIPDETIRERDIEELALQRLNLFKLIDISKRKGYKIYSNKWTEDVMLNIYKNYKDTFYKLCKQSAALNDPPESELEHCRMDYISHHILRIGYSSLEELQRWFIERETEWLYLRYQAQSIESKQLFLVLNNVNYVEIDDKEKGQILENLCEGHNSQETYYKIEYNEAIDLISKRKVYLKAGYAYVPFQDLIWCIMTRYKLYLEKCLLHTSRNLLLLDKAYINLIDLIKNMINERISNEDSDNSNRDITISGLKKYSQHNFPLCMKSLYDRLKEVNHLKYGSRIQLGNFIKALGLSLEDSLNFWRHAFAYKVTSADFEDNYSYNIKHMYGKVGRMREYLPDMCTDITKHAIGVGETHGCPFKTWDTLHLAQKLKKCNVSQSSIDEIVSEAQNKRYQEACCKYFKAVHNVSHDMIIHSPLQYFEQSNDILKHCEDPFEGDSDVE